MAGAAGGLSEGASDALLACVRRELQARARDGPQREEAVDEVDREVERLGQQLELEVHLDEPVLSGGRRWATVRRGRRR